jgi:gliding motility-associated-like protein
MVYCKKMRKLFFLIVGVFITQLFVNDLRAQSACPNADFSQGNFSNWQGFTGNYTNPAQTPGITPGRHTIMNASAIDPFSCGGLNVLPPGGSFSARLGNSGTGAQGEQLRYTLAVTNQNALFVYKYAVVLENPAGHSPNEQPEFRMRILNQAGQPIGGNCGQYTVYGGQPGQNFQTCGGVTWLPWTISSVNLTPYIGQNVTIEFTTKDCSLSGHYGYAYVAAECMPLIIDIEYCPGDNSVVLTAPPGFQSYQWNPGGATTQSITINNPVVGSTYSCTLTSFSNQGSCQVTLSVQIVPTIVDAGFTFSPACQGVPIQFTDTSTVANGTLGSWLWDFGDGDTSTAQNPTHIYNTSGTYDVTLIAFSTASCSDTITQQINIFPIPDAQYTYTPACPGDPVQFTNNSTGTTSLTYSWNFDDPSSGSNNTSSTQDPTHVFNTAGTYNVMLTATNTNGCVDTLIQQVEVNSGAVPDFNFTSQCAGTAINFTDASTIAPPITITSYSWNFGGGNTATGTTASHVFNTPGIHNVTLVVTTSLGCSDSIIKPVRVYANPVADFTHLDVCYGNTVNFTNTSTVSSTDTITDYLWAFGNGNTSTAQNPTQNYAAPGSYNVTLITTSTGGCSDVITHQVNIYDLPVADFVFENKCENIQATFTNTTQQPISGNVTSWSWNYGDGSPLDTVNWDGVHTYTTTGTYTVTLITNNTIGCSDTVSHTILVHPTPVANFNFTNRCLVDAVNFVDASTGVIASYHWNFGDTDTSNISSPSHTYNNPGFYNVTLSVTSDSGCTHFSTQQVQIYPMPTADFDNVEVCHGNNSVFADLSTVQPPSFVQMWTWDFGDSSPISNMQNTTHQYANPGIYNATLIVSTNYNCMDTITKVVVVNPNPVVDFNADIVSGCSPLCVNFADNSTILTGANVEYKWNYGNGAYGTGNTGSHCFYNDGAVDPITTDISLTVTSDKGCTTIVTKANYITVYPTPIADFEATPQPTTIRNPNITFYNKTIGGYSYVWEFGDNTATTTEIQPFHTYIMVGEYEVTLIASNQWGCIDTIVKTLVIDDDFAFYIPNAFTPNGDGANDIFSGKGYGIKQYEMLIFDRWGEKIYETTDLSKGWDGTYRNVEAQQDVYIYKVTIIDVHDEKHQYRGHFTLIR